MLDGSFMDAIFVERAVCEWAYFQDGEFDRIDLFDGKIDFVLAFGHGNGNKNGIGRRHWSFLFCFLFCHLVTFLKARRYCR